MRVNSHGRVWIAVNGLGISIPSSRVEANSSYIIHLDPRKHNALLFSCTWQSHRDNCNTMAENASVRSRAAQNDETELEDVGSAAATSVNNRDNQPESPRSYVFSASGLRYWNP